MIFAHKNKLSLEMGVPYFPPPAYLDRRLMMFKGIEEREKIKNGSASTKDRSEVHLTSKLHQRSVVNYIQGIDWQKGSSAPMVVELDPTTACNLACPDCINRDLLNQGFFSRKRMRELTREMIDAGVRAVILIGGGEPLVHPEIGWVIDHLGENNIQIGLTTNGLLINKYIDSIAKHVSWTRVSVDAATSETFKRIRPSRSGKSKLNQVIENMRLLAKVKKGKLGYSFMIYSEGKFDKKERDNEAMVAEYNTKETDGAKLFSNVSEIYQAALLAKEIACDYFEVKPMYDIRHFAITQRKEMIEKSQGEVEKALLLASDDFRVLQAAKLGNTFNEEHIEPKEYTRCAVAEARTLVTPSGTYVCPYFRGRKDKKIGDVTKMSFTDMWRGEKRAKVIGDLDPSKDCKMHCIRHDSNLIIEDMIAGKKVEMVDDFDLFI